MNNTKYDNARIQEINDAIMIFTKLNEHDTHALHNATRGIVRLFYSDTQAKAFIKTRAFNQAANPDAPRPLGFIPAMDVTTGEIVEYTDVDVLRGNADMIKIALSPMSYTAVMASEIPKLPQCKDVEELPGKYNPCNLLRLKTPFGLSAYHYFDARDLKGSGLVQHYGRDHALEILPMIARLPVEYHPVFRDDRTHQRLSLYDLIRTKGDVAEITSIQVEQAGPVIFGPA